MAKKQLTEKKKPKEIIKPKTLNEIRDVIKSINIGYDAGYILEKAEEERQQTTEGDSIEPGTNLYKSLSLFEFDNGMFLTSSIFKMYGTFALDFNKNLQKEYNCTTSSEKSLAEVTTLNFVRVLQVQNNINSCLSKSSITDIGTGYLNVLSKELDRAQRHYLTSLQTLKMFKMPSLSVNIKTQTAIVGENQIVQSNHE